MTDQADTGTTLCVPLSAVRDVLSDHLAPGLVDRSLTALTTVSLRLPTESLENFEPLLTDLEEFKAKLATALNRFQQFTAGTKAEAGMAVERIGGAPTPQRLTLLTGFISLLGRREVLPTEAHESLAGLLKLITVRIRQLDDAIRVATALKTTIDGAADDFRMAARGESNDEKSDTDDADYLARAHLEAHLNEVLEILRRDTLPSGKTPLLACDPDQLPFYTQAAIRSCVGRFYPS